MGGRSCCSGRSRARGELTGAMRPLHCALSRCALLAAQGCLEGDSQYECFRHHSSSVVHSSALGSVGAGETSHRSSQPAAASHWPCGSQWRGQQRRDDCSTS